MFSPRTLTEFDQIKRRYPTAEAALLPLLHAAQRERGYIDAEAEELIASYLGLAPVRVHGVASFYTMYNRAPVGKYLIQVCRTLSCELRGSVTLLEHIRSRLRIAEGETTADGRFSLMAVECLGSCGTAPAAQINDDYYEDLTPEKMDRVLDGLE